MITPETRVQIRRYFYAEHWKIGTIARELSVHPDAVRHAIESERFNRTEPMRASITDPYMEFVRQTLDRHPRLRAAHSSDDPGSRLHRQHNPAEACRGPAAPDRARTFSEAAGIPR